MNFRNIDPAPRTNPPLALLGWIFFGHIKNILGNIRNIFGHTGNIFGHTGNIFDHIGNKLNHIGLARHIKRRNTLSFIFSLFGVFALQRLCRVPIDILEENFNIACRQKEEKSVFFNTLTTWVFPSHTFTSVLVDNDMEFRVNMAPSILSAGQLTLLSMVIYTFFQSSIFAFTFLTSSICRTVDMVARGHPGGHRGRAQHLI